MADTFTTAFEGRGNHTAPINQKKTALKETSAFIHPEHPFFDIIEQAYRAFACPKPKDTGVCKRCCMEADIEADFFKPDIRELPLSYVRDWYFAACDRGGVPQETWKYLLPRILEILAAGEDVSNTGLEVSFCRFETGNPKNWSANEWAVLDRFQRTYLHRHIIEGGQNLLDDVICMFRRGGDPPPRKWSDSKYGCFPRGGLEWRRKTTSRKRSSRSSGRLMCLSHKVRRSPMSCARSA